MSTKGQPQDKKAISISKYLDPDLIAFFSAESRDEAIHTLVHLLASKDVLIDKNQFQKAITDREKIVTTGIGMGVAIPHAKIKTYSDFFIAMGILDKGVDWGALDGAPVRLIFMIGGPDDKQNEYLKLLSSLTLALKDEERRKKVLKAASPSEVIKLFE